MRLEHCGKAALFLELLVNLWNLCRLCVFALRSIVVFDLIIILLIEQLVERQVLLEHLIGEILDSAESSPLECGTAAEDAGDRFVGELVAPTQVQLLEVGTLVSDGQDGFIVELGGLGEVEGLEEGRCDFVDYSSQVEIVALGESKLLHL